MFDLFYLGGTAPCPALHHLGWPWLGAPVLRWLPLWVPDASSKSSSPPLRVALALHPPTQLTTIEVGPGLGTFFSSLYSLPTLLSPLWPPRPLESKVIQIQSDHPPASSPPVAAMERSKVICSIQVWGRDVGLSSKVSLDFAGVGSPCSWAPLLFLLLDVAFLHRRPPRLWDGQVYLVVEESLVSFFSPRSLFFRRASGLLSEGTTRSSSPFFFPPCAAPSSQVPLGRILHALGMTFAMLTQWAPLTVSLASHLLDIFFYSGLAGPRYLLEKNFWEESECRLAACPRPLFHAVSPSPGLVKLPCALQPTGMR